MALDAAPFVGDLDTNLPNNRDPRAEGAGQIRAVKTALKNSFPNVKGEITASHDQINKIDQHAFKVGMIMDFWTNNIDADPPEGWGWCDGEVYNNMLTPDLREKYIKAWDGDLSTIGKTGGKTDIKASEVTDCVEVGDFKLTLSHLPEVKVDMWATRDNGENSGGERYLSEVNSGGRDGAPVEKLTVPGGGESHKHPVSPKGDGIKGIEPNYYILAKIMFVGFPA